MKANPISSYGWNEAAGRYVDLSTGRFVPFASVRGELENLIVVSERNMEVVSRRLAAGEITLPEWQVVMEREIKQAHIASGALAKGGWGQMTQSDWGWVGQRVREQYQFMRRFAQEIYSGRQPLNGRFFARARLYGQASRATYEEMRRRYARLNQGAVEERRVVTPGAEHCQPHGEIPGCAELAARGWQPIGSLPPIGAASCLVFCKCRFELRDAEGNFI